MLLKKYLVLMWDQRHYPYSYVVVARLLMIEIE